MRKLIFNLHLYGALAAGLFVVIIGVTGSIMAFEDDIDRLANPALFHVQPQGMPLSLTDLFKAAQRAYPGQKINYIRLPLSATDTASFNVKGPRQVFINPYTGAIAGDRSPFNTLFRIHQLHLRLLMSYTASAGKIGADIVAIATAVLLFLVISGVYLWWPVKRATVKWSANLRRISFDLHNTTGIYSAAFLVVLGVTGIVVHFDDDLEEYLHKQAGTQKILKNIPSAVQSGGTPISPDQSVQIALAALPGTKALALSVPPNPKASYLVALHYPEDLTPGGRSWVNVDQFSGKVLSFQDSRTVAMSTRAVKIFNRAVHTGDVYGYPTKILASLSSVLLVIQAITGYYMWWKKLRVRQDRAEAVETAA
jgi:uncharacterized iron-regulated membrane protein